MSEKGLRIDQIAGGKYMLPNQFINPGFEIWQRGAGPFVSLITTQTVFSADEWAILTNGGTITVQRSSSPASGNYAIEMSNSTNDPHAISQGFEKYKSYEGLYITFSVMVKSTVASDTRLVLADRDGATTENAFSDYHPGDNAWHRLTVTKLIRSGLVSYASWAHGFGIIAQIISSNTASVFIDEAVSVAAEVPFPEGLSYAPLNSAEDMQRCQRFYQTHISMSQGIYFGGASASGFQWNMQLPTEMQGTPTLTPSFVYGGVAQSSTAGPNFSDTIDFTAGSSGAGFGSVSVGIVLEVT